MRAVPDAAFTVYIVDDDGSVRDALALLLGVHGYRPALFADAESFLGACAPDWQGCMLLDIRMPGMDGLALQRRMRERDMRMPVIVMTGHGDVVSAREAFRSQALDFLEKPLDHAKLLAAIEEARARQAEDSRAIERGRAFAERLARLTPREREVMDLVIAGRHNREVAALLGISPRTVEVHKARVMEKLEVDSVPQLVRLSLEASR